MINSQAIIELLNHPGALYRVQGIRECIKSGSLDVSIIERLQQLTNDDTELIGWTVGQFAVAALDVLGVEKYSGDDQYMIDLISNLPELVNSDG